MSGEHCPVERADSLTVGHVAHDHELGCICQGLLKSELDLCVKRDGDGLSIIEAVSAQDRVDVRVLRQVYCATCLVALYLNPEHPVQLAKVCNFDVLMEASLEGVDS